MSELDAFETRFATAYRRYLEEAPTEVDAAAVVQTVVTTHPRGRPGALAWALRPTPALVWLVLLALLLASLGAAAFFVGSQPVRMLPAVVPPVGPTATTSTAHTTVSEGTYIAVSSDGSHTCAVTTDRTIECWGGNSVGQAIPPDGTYIAVSAGGDHTCAIRTDGKLYAGARTPPARRLRPMARTSP